MSITQFKGKIPVTENMYAILKTISENKKESTAKTHRGYLVTFDRLIDPIIVATLYGLYKSRVLPPVDLKDYPLEKSYEFGNVDISDFSDKLSHLLFCLWVKENGFPNQKMNLADYRQNLYGFISKIISERYFIDVVVPFYLQKADESDGERSSFIYRLWSSDDISIISEQYSPEFIAVEFYREQKGFIDDIIMPTASSTLSLHEGLTTTALDVFLNSDESYTLEFKSTLLYDINAAEHGVEKANPTLERAVLKEVCAFLNSQGGNILIGVSDDKKDGQHEVIGLSNDYKVLSVRKKDKDGFEVQLRNGLNALEPKIQGLGLVNILFETKGGLDVCIIEVKAADKEIFLRPSMGDKELEFWIREGNSTIQLKGPQMVEYSRKHWPHNG